MMNLDFLTIEQFPGGPVLWELFLEAWGWTFKIAVVSWFIALILGALIGTIRTLPQDKLSNRILIMLGNAWVDVFRNVPILVQMFLWLFVIPVLIPPLQVLKSHQFIMAVCALGIFTSTRIAEQVRAGIDSIPRGQRNAALALGLNTWQTYTYVLVPITARVIMPPLTSEAMNIVKNSTVAVVLPGIYDLMTFAGDVGGNNENIILRIFLLVTFAFAITSIASNRVMRFIEKRIQIPGFASGSSGRGK